MIASVLDEATNFQKREIAMSDQSSPTNKSKAHLEAVDRNTQREVNQDVYREVNQKVYQEVNQN
jgi:hypothetical protein